MGVAVFLGILFFLLAGGGIAFGVLSMRDKKSARGQTTKGNKVRGGIFCGAGVAFLLLFFLIPFSFHTVEAGEVAVVKHMGEAREIRTAGTYFDFWLTEKYQKYDAKVQSLNIVSPAYSKDAQTMDVGMTVQYQIDSGKAIEIANHYGNVADLSNRIESVSIEKAKSVLSSRSAMEIIEKRAQISPLVETTIKESVDENYYVHIVAVVLTNIDFSDAFEKTVEDKMIAEQEKLKAEYEKETAIVNANKELEVAKLQALARIEQAKADAQAQLEIAKAEAAAIRLKSVEVARTLGLTVKEKAITDENGVVTDIEYEIVFGEGSDEKAKLIVEYLKYVEYLAKWNGELPNVVITDGNATVMIPSNPIA